MTIQTPETQPQGFIEHDLIFRRSDPSDQVTIRGIGLALELAVTHEEQSLQADFDFVDEQEFESAFDSDAAAKKELKVLELPVNDVEIVREANKEGVEIGESQVVRSLSLENRVDIANKHRTSLVVHEDEAEALTGVMMLAEDIAENRPTLNIPQNIFTHALKDLSEGTSSDSFAQAA